MPIQCNTSANTNTLFLLTQCNALRYTTLQGAHEALSCAHSGRAAASKGAAQSLIPGVRTVGGFVGVGVWVFV
jgi:hypothetical protein